MQHIHDSVLSLSVLTMFDMNVPLHYMNEDMVIIPKVVYRKYSFISSRSGKYKIQVSHSSITRNLLTIGLKLQNKFNKVNKVESKMKRTR